MLIRETKLLLASSESSHNYSQVFDDAIAEIKKEPQEAVRESFQPSIVDDESLKLVLTTPAQWICEVRQSIYNFFHSLAFYTSIVFPKFTGTFLGA